MTLYVPTKADKTYYKDMSVCILTPCRDNECAIKFTKCVANLIAYSAYHGLQVHAMGATERMVVHWARNDLVKQALGRNQGFDGKPFTHFLWLDDDQVFNPDMLVRLASYNLDIVSALYYGRCQDHLPVAYVKDFNADQYKHFPLIEPPTTLAEIDAVGFGAVLTRRDIFEKVPEPWFSFEDGAGEDIFFCVKAKKHGFRVWLDGAYRIGHIGEPIIVTSSTNEESMKRNADKYGDRIKVGLGGKKI